MNYHLPPYDVELECSTFAQLSQQPVEWWSSTYGVPDVWKVTKGGGVTVAVLDTGADTDHPDLQPAIAASRDFTNSGYEDRNGHGSHCVGLVGARGRLTGIAPECKVLVGKVLADHGGGNDVAIAAGVDWAVQAGAQIISMSLGAPSPSRWINDAIHKAVARGVVVICAAGNDGRPGSVNYPAATEDTIAVSAVDRHGRLARFSSHGPQVDVAAPGQDIRSTYKNGGYAVLSGTSMATPVAAGVAALALSAYLKGGGDANLSPQVIREWLADHATDAGSPGRDPSFGFGLINPASMVQAPAAPESELDAIVITVPRGTPISVNGKSVTSA